MGIIICIAFVMTVIYMLYVIGELGSESREKAENVLLKHGISKDDIKISLSSGDYCILTTDNKVYASHDGGIVYSIKTEDILDISSNLHVSQKNKKRLIALTTTYDSSTVVEGVELKLITEMDSFRVHYDTRNSNPNGIIDKVERFEFIVKREMNKINSK